MQPASSKTENLPENPPVEIIELSEVSLFNRATMRLSSSIRHPDYPKGKPFSVRFPTDKEWCDRSRALTLTNRSIGRDVVKRETKGDEEADLRLLHAILVNRDETIDWDSAEAAKILEALSKCRVAEVHDQGNQYQIDMEVCGGFQVSHTLKVPTQRQILDFQKAAVPTVNRRNAQEMRVLLEPTMDLWKKLMVDYIGYPSPVAPFVKDNIGMIPVIHMDAAITELLAQVNSLIDEGPAPEE